MSVDFLISTFRWTLIKVLDFYKHVLLEFYSRTLRNICISLTWVNYLARCILKKTPFKKRKSWKVVKSTVRKAHSCNFKTNRKTNRKTRDSNENSLLFILEISEYTRYSIRLLLPSGLRIRLIRMFIRVCKSIIAQSITWKNQIFTCKIYKQFSIKWIFSKKLAFNNLQFFDKFAKRTLIYWNILWAFKYNSDKSTIKFQICVHAFVETPFSFVN